MKQETKANLKVKVTRVMNSVNEWIVPIVLFSTATAVWSGHVMSCRNERKIRALENNQDMIKSAVNLNAENLNEAIDRIRSLEKENDKLLDKAVFITEEKSAAE